jgi:hypothetical protein
MGDPVTVRALPLLINLAGKYIISQNEIEQHWSLLRGRISRLLGWVDTPIRPEDWAPTDERYIQPMVAH